MKKLLSKSSPVAWFLLGLLVAGGTGTAYAANGGTFRLGQSNSATATTKLTNTKGTALKIISKSSTPPLSVGSNSTKVPYLNADKVDGLNASQIATLGGGWAVVRPDGTTVRASSGVTVTKPSTGIYCVRVPGVNSQTRTATALPDWTNSATAGQVVSHIEIASDSNDCVTKSDFDVRTFTFDLSTNALNSTDNAFSFAVAR